MVAVVAPMSKAQGPLVITGGVEFKAGKVVKVSARVTGPLPETSVELTFRVYAVRPVKSVNTTRCWDLYPATVTLNPPLMTVVAGSLVSHSITALVLVSEETVGPEMITGGVVSGRLAVVKLTVAVVGPLPEGSVAETVAV